MKLSTRSRYGARLMVDLAEHYDEGPIQMGDIAKRQGISVKYLEQLIIPLKKSNFIQSVRGPKGGHMLARPPEKINLGEIVKVLEGGIDLADCIEKPQECSRSGKCVTRGVWEEATKAMYDKLNSITLHQIIEEDKVL
ncbi:MAG: Rrf2 family transcriptional regulator [Deltaproteobacteria bacterium]|nr:Rrf2 family transcriptional regulator [Deltaproteobacteria bacterium]